MKNHISDEEKKKQIEQMWEDYERANKQNPQQFKTNSFSDLDVDIDDDEALSDPSFDSPYEQSKYKNRRKSKKSGKKSKFSEISDEDSD